MLLNLPEKHRKQDEFQSVHQMYEYELRSAYHYVSFPVST